MVILRRRFGKLRVGVPATAKQEVKTPGEQAVSQLDSNVAWTSLTGLNCKYFFMIGKN